MTASLTLSCDDSDITRALVTGEVSPTDVELDVDLTYPPKRHRQFCRTDAYDVAELCLASSLAAQEEDVMDPFTAIPVFPSKTFRHAFFYTRSDADIDEPSDLEGGDVGIQSWQTAANVWMRGILQEHYGLDLESVRWHRRREDDVPRSIPDRYDVRSVSGPQGGDAIESPRDLTNRLLDGDLDAVMDPAGSLLERAWTDDELAFVFDDPMNEEKRYYERTGIVPIMHVVAIRDRVLEADPTIAGRIFDAFVRARDRGLERVRRPSYTMSLVWAHLHRLEQQSVLGPGETVWEYGLTERNRRAFETFARYAHQQGIIDRQYDPEDVFVTPD